MARRKRTVTVTTHYDGGGGNKISIPESEWCGTRTNPQTRRREALVIVGGDSGGNIKEWVPINE